MARLRNKRTGVVVNVPVDEMDGYEPAEAAEQPVKRGPGRPRKSE